MCTSEGSAAFCHCSPLHAGACVMFEAGLERWFIAVTGGFWWKSHSTSSSSCSRSKACAVLHRVKAVEDQHSFITCVPSHSFLLLLRAWIALQMNCAAMGESVSGSCLGMSKQDTGVFSSFFVRYGFGVEIVECGVLTTSCWFGCRVVGSVNRSVLTLKWSN